MKTFKQYLVEEIVQEGKKPKSFKDPDAPTIQNFVAKHARNKSGAGEHTIKTKVKKKYAKRKDKHKGKLTEATNRDRWLQSQGKGELDPYELAKEIYNRDDYSEIFDILSDTYNGSNEDLEYYLNNNAEEDDVIEAIYYHLIRKDKHKGNLTEITNKDRWLQSQGKEPFDPTELAREIFDHMDIHDLESIVGDIFANEDDADDFLANSDGEDQLELVKDWVIKQGYKSKKDYYDPDGESTT